MVAEVKFYNGTKIYYNKAGWRHREDGPAMEWANGSKSWWLNGLKHREDGPAIELSDGDKYWYLNGKLHREDGPAVQLVNGYKSWYLDGKKIDCSSNEEFLKLIKLKSFW